MEKRVGKVPFKQGRGWIESGPKTQGKGGGHGDLQSLVGT